MKCVKGTRRLAMSLVFVLSTTIAPTLHAHDDDGDGPGMLKCDTGCNCHDEHAWYCTVDHDSVCGSDDECIYHDGDECDLKPAA